MRARAPLAAATAAVGLLLPIAAAEAQNGCDAPPGTGAIEQYCESLPSATGERPSGRPADASIEPGVAARLRQAGPDGTAVLSLPAAVPTPKSSGGRGERARSAPEQPSDAPIAAVGSGVESGSSVDAGFLWLLAAVAVLLAALGWMRSRRKPEA